MGSCDTCLYVNVTMVSPQQWTLCPNIRRSVNLVLIVPQVDATNYFEHTY